jgi:two-component system LytT family response regulator
MIKAILVDDEKSARQTLSKLIEKYCTDVQIVGYAESVDEAEKLILQSKPDIVFLDIEMPEKNGFELLELFKAPNFEVIFTTAYQDYALKAFRYAAIDYLQKPIDFRLLIQAIGRYKQKAENRFQKERYELLMSNIHFNNQEVDKIAIPTSRGFKFTQVSDIVYCKANGVYSELYLLNGIVISASKSLKELVELLPEKLFFRSHKTYLININHCVEYNRAEELILMLNKDLIPLSKRSKPLYLELFK